MTEENKNKYEGNLHRRFVLKVLAPPFIALFVLSLVGLWQLDVILRKQAIDGMQRSATTTSTALQRELSLRETVLKRTGTELLLIKSEYQTARAKLDENRDACREFIRTTRNFRNSPNGVCEPFASGLANQGTRFTVLEDEYVAAGNALIADQDQRINERLSAFKQVFPETLAIVITDNSKQVVSSALSGAFKGSTAVFKSDSETALNGPVYGHLVDFEDFRLAVFGFPIAGGSVLAAYDLHNEQFIRQTWQDAPIDRKQAVAVIMDADNNVAYPSIGQAEDFRKNGLALRTQRSIEMKLDGVDHTIVATAATPSNWLVAVASPTAAVLAPLRDSQMLALIFIGIFMVSFTWVGSFFIQRTLRNIVGLVSGAMVFGSGRLDYKIQLDHADAEFVRLGETMNVMAERIASAEREIDEKNKEFISIATHEIRAPLTSIIGNLSMFQDMHSASLDKQANDLINQAYYSSARLRDLVNDMLNVARLESGRSEFALAPLNIETVIRDVVDTMSVVAKMSKVSLAYNDDSATTVSADEGRLRIIINNFVSNAIKYNRPGGRVLVSHQLRENMLITSIQDNGLGIPEDQKAHMFEKFFRVNHEDRSSVTGTGLGMYITKQYIEQMGGRLWYESEHGKGTSFYFSLPAVTVTLKTRIKSKIKKVVKKANPRKIARHRAKVLRHARKAQKSK